MSPPCWPRRSASPMPPGSASSARGSTSRCPPVFHPTHCPDRPRTAADTTARPMKLYFDDADFDYQLQRTAAKGAYRACDLGEIFAIASRIVPGDYESWHREWHAAGE